MIEINEIEAVAAHVTEAGLSEPTVRDLRARWPQMHFTLCLDDDVSVAARPVREEAGFNLYLVTGTGGCISFTRSAASATGIVVAETEEDA